MVIEGTDVLAERENDEPFWSDEYQCWFVKWTDEWVVMVTPMIFNDRILLESRSDYPWGYNVGWCYDKGTALRVALEWDPDTEDEPQGYKKAVGRRYRRYV